MSEAPGRPIELADQFAGVAAAYARHRPRYPEALFAFLASLCPEPGLAWDCATGSGQAAVGLAEHFRRVVATDASAEQLSQATPHPRVTYRRAPAEDCGLESASVDLVAVAQAIHWLDLERFYAECRRVLKPGGVLAVWCYDLPRILPAVDEILRHYRDDVVGPYWKPQIHWVNEHYATLPFPFPEIPPLPDLAIRVEWDLQELIGYLGSWSSTARYARARGESALDRVLPALREAWGAEATKRAVRWPLYARVGRRDL